MNKPRAKDPPCREGSLLVVTEGMTLLPCCPICNSREGTNPVSVRFSISRPTSPTSDMLGNALRVAQGWKYSGPVVIDVPLCSAHRARLKRRFLAGLLAAAVGAVGLLVCLIAGVGGAAMFLSLAALAGGIFGMIIVRFGSPNLWFDIERIDDRTVWLYGASPAYLDALDTVAPQTVMLDLGSPVGRGYNHAPHDSHPTQ